MSRNRFIALIVLVSGIMIAASAFLPWADSALLSVSGTELEGADALTVLGIGIVVALVAAAIFFMHLRYSAWHGFVDLLFLAPTVIFVAVHNILHLDRPEYEGASAGAGLWLLFSGGTLFVVFAILAIASDFRESLPESRRGWTFTENWRYYATGQSPSN